MVSRECEDPWQERKEYQSTTIVERGCGDHSGTMANRECGVPFEEG